MDKVGRSFSTRNPVVEGESNYLVSQGKNNNDPDERLSSTEGVSLEISSVWGRVPVKLPRCMRTSHCHFWKLLNLYRLQGLGDKEWELR